MRAAFVISAVVGVLTVFARPADADEVVGVLHLDVAGVSSTAAGKFESSIEEGLSGTGFKVAPRKRLTELLANSSFVKGCLFGPCLSEVYRNTKVRLVLVARISRLGPSYSYVVSLLDTRTGRPTSQVADLCDVCTLEEAIATATLAVIELVTGVGAAKVDPDLGPTGKGKIPDLRGEIAVYAKRVRKAKSRNRRAAEFFLGVAAIAIGTGAYFVSNDQDTRGYATIAGGAAFAVAGTSLVVISRRF